MKKFLSLVLALVMTMSLVTISAGAKDFTDDSAINYDEAVDVLSALKIVGGDTTGAFNPQGGLTRGAAAKIICNLILGPTTAGALNADAAPYKDVPANHTYAGYIAYCKQQGIISGYSDGNFKPAAPLTGYAFMKMLLGALGYDSTLEGYVGANWSIAVAKQAISIGLDDGNDEFSGVAPVTREQAALYAFNTLKADIVEYKDKGTNITIGGTTINTGASKAEPVLQATSGLADKLGGSYANNVQFCEKYFKKLVRDTTPTAFGEPATTWRVSGEKVGTYAKTPDLTYTEKVKGKNVWADLDMAAAATTVNYIVDGVAVAAGSTPAVNKTESGKFGGQGALTSVYLSTNDTTGATTVRVITKNIYAAKIVSINDATATTKRTVNIAPLGPSLTGATSFETENFARKDIVYYTAASTNGTTSSYEIKSMALAEKISGQLTAFAGNTSVVVGGTTYKMGAKAATTGASYTGSLKDIVDLYMDANGNVLEIKTSEAADASYAYVLNQNMPNALATSTAFTPYKAELLFLDGTKKIVETSANVFGLAGGFVSFTINSADKYVLTEADYTSGAAGMQVTNGASAVTINNTTVYGNDETIFVVATAGVGGTVYTVYTGIKNVPSLNNGASPAAATLTQAAVVCKTSNVANYVYIDATTGVTIAGGTNNVIFVLGSKNADKNVNVDNNGYYVLDAVVNGEITELNVDDGVVGIDALTNGAPVSQIFASSNTDKYGITTLTSATGFSSVGLSEVEKGVVTFFVNGVEGDAGDVTYPVAKDCSVFYVDSKILTWDVDSIAYDLNDVVYYTVKDGAVNNMFIVAK